MFTKFVRGQLDRFERGLAATRTASCGPCMQLGIRIAPAALQPEQ